MRLRCAEVASDGVASLKGAAAHREEKRERGKMEEMRGQRHAPVPDRAEG